MRGSRSGLRHLRWLLDRVGPSPRLCLTRLISTPSSDKSEGAQCLMVNKDGHEINEQVCHIGTPKGVSMCDCVCARRQCVGHKGGARSWPPAAGHAATDIKYRAASVGLRQGGMPAWAARAAALARGA